MRRRVEDEGNSVHIGVEELEDNEVTKRVTVEGSVCCP